LKGGGCETRRRDDLRFALGLVPVEYLYAPPQDMAIEEPKAQGRQVRADYKKQVPFPAQGGEG